MKKLLATLTLVASLSPLSALAMSAQQYNDQLLAGKPFNVVQRYERGELNDVMVRHHTSFGTLNYVSLDRNHVEMKNLVSCYYLTGRACKLTVDPLLQTGTPAK